MTSVALPARQDPDPQAVRARLHAYLTSYEQELSTLIAEEHLRQWPLRGAGATTGAVLSGRRDLTRIRSLVAEVAFVPLPGNVGWLGYRDVTSIGGRAVRRKGPSLLDLLKARTDDSRERAMTLLLESARHNLGAPRTINLPSLPLELLHPRNQARFVIAAHEMARTDHCVAMRLMRRGEGEAVYTNYRRFTTSARIVAQP